MFTLLYNIITKSLVVLLVAMLSVNYLPDTLFGDFPFEAKSLEPNNFDSVIPQWNTKLSDSFEVIGLNQILGPESIVVAKDGMIYTGLADGRLVELNPNKNYQVRTVFRFNTSPTCKDNVATKATECGRILQLRLLNDTLYALESNTGLYKVDTKSGSKTFIGPKPLGPVNMYNSFAFDPIEKNMLYLTLSSRKRDLLTIMWSLLEYDTSGTVIAFDMSTGKRVLFPGPFFSPNGLDVDSKRDKLILSETLKARIVSYDLKTIRSAFMNTADGHTIDITDLKKTSLIPLTPGNPDNLYVKDDILYIALPMVKLNGKELVDHLATMPSIRITIARTLFGFGKLVEYISENFYKHPFLETIYGELKSGHLLYRIATAEKSAIVEYNLATGASKLYGSDKFGFVSEAVPYSNGHLLLGSFRSAFIVKVKL